jgi:outer membrane immunogenic protein
LGSATARVGYSFTDHWLVFVNGGAAWTQEKIDDAFTNLAGIAVDPGATMIRTGWTAGGGVEYAFDRNWTAKLGYNYYDFGSHGGTLIGVTNVTFRSLNDTINETTIGLNYHF